MTSFLDFHDKLIVVHAVFAALAALFTAPFAIIIARWYLNPWRSFKLHSAVNTFTGVFIVIAFALGTVAVSHGGHGSQFTGKKADVHHDLGLSIFIVALVQVFLGITSHFTKAGPLPAQTTGSLPTFTAHKSHLRIVHIFIGISLVVLLFAQMWSGFNEWDSSSDNGTLTPRGVRVVYWVILGLEVAMYLIGCILEPFIIRRANAKVNSRSEDGKRESVS